MNYQPKISLIFSLLLVLMFYGEISFSQTKNVIPTEQSKPVANAGKISSSNIHIDDIAIKVSSDTQSGNSPISDEDHKRLVSKLSDDAKEEVISWIKRQWWLTDIFGIAVIITMILSIFATIKISVHMVVDKHVTKLIEATKDANQEIKLAQETLKDFRKKRDELNEKLEDFHNKVDEEIEKYKKIKDQLDSNLKTSEERTTDEINELRDELKNKIKYLQLIINEIDKDNVVKNNVVDKLITDLQSEDKETKYSAAELLSQFEIESNNIVDAFIKALKNTQDKKFSSILISELGKLKCDNESLNYLLELLNNLNDTNILLIIGTLGELGEIGKNKITDIALESVINKLLLILNVDIDNTEFASDITASQVRIAIALAFSFYGDKAAKAVKPLISLLLDKDQEVRKNSANALGAIGQKAKDAIPALRKLENDEYAEVRVAASEAIEKIQQTA